MSLLTTQESQAIKIELQQNRLTASKSTPEIGEAKEEIDIEYSGEALVVGFNPAYLSDVLKNIDEEMVELELTGPEKPGVIRTAGGYLYIVLPMQIV
jgi:DNA polymerase-3 subunit beta